MSEKQRNIFVFSSWLIYHLITVLSVCNGQRRILGGHPVTVNHTFMVYLVKAESSDKVYSAWLCGGTLVRKRIAITSAACVRDVKHMYLIAGYNRYVNEDKRDTDKCISKMKRKVIIICTPAAYELDYTNQMLWSTLDIAVIKTDKDVVGVEGYRKYCHYVPASISVNYNNRLLQEAGKDVLFLGWGHEKEYRKEQDNTDYNLKTLHYGSTKVYDKKKCLERYYGYHMDALISRFSICTWPPESFNDQASKVRPNVESDELDILKLKDHCSDEKEDNGPNQTEDTFEQNTVGICQNDHGGPLISWLVDDPKVIGVASAFKVGKQKCKGPFIFTSTYCSSKFLKCVINELTKDDEPKGARRSMNGTGNRVPEESGFRIINRRISWLNHPDGLTEDLLRNLEVELSPLLPFIQEERGLTNGIKSRRE